MSDNNLKGVILEGLLQTRTVSVGRTLAFCSDESLTSFGKHQRRNSQKPFFGGTNLRNLDSLPTFVLMKCF